MLTGAGLLGMVPAATRAAAWAGGSEGLEKTRLALGFVPLIDCAVLVVALEKSFFRSRGLDVRLSREPSWANIRDKVTAGALDGAQVLAPIPIAATLGLGRMTSPMVTAFSMGLNGNAVAVSTALWERMRDADAPAATSPAGSARALRQVIEADKSAGRPPMTFATVFPYSAHHYQLRYWMAAAGIDPDHDVRLVVIPPPQMPENLRDGHIAGYCAGEPWCSQAVRLGAGQTVVSSYEIWNNSPEKVLATTLAWADRHPRTHQAMITALLDAARWAEEPGNGPELAVLLAREDYVGLPAEVISQSLGRSHQDAPGQGRRPRGDVNVFHRYAANFPWRSHAEWFITQMLRWGQVDRAVDIRACAAQVYRPDIYREAAQATGVAAPSADHKTEGTHAGPWVLGEADSPVEMGPDLFLDGMRYDPGDLLGYLQGLAVTRMALPLDSLAARNA